MRRSSPFARTSSAPLPDLSGFAPDLSGFVASSELRISHCDEKSQITDFFKMLLDNVNNELALEKWLPLSCEAPRGVSEGSEQRVFRVGELSTFLPKLVKEDDLPINKDQRSARYAVTEDFEFLFGQEGKPSRRVPAHRQLSECGLVYGNIYFNDDDQVCGVSNKSGDFRPSKSRLLWALIVLVHLRDEGKIKLADTLRVAYNLEKTNVMLKTAELTRGCFPLPFLAKEKVLIQENKGKKRKDSEGSSPSGKRRRSSERSGSPLPSGSFVDSLRSSAGLFPLVPDRPSPPGRRRLSFPPSQNFK